MVKRELKYIRFGAVTKVESVAAWSGGWLCLSSQEGPMEEALFELEFRGPDA